MQKRPTFADIFPLPLEARRLEVFLGNWKVKGTLTFLGKRFEVKGVANFSSVATGWGILVTAKLEIQSLGTYEEADLLAYNRSEKLYHFFAVTNTAAAYDHKGKWLNDDTISFLHEGLQDGKSYKEELEIKVINENQLAIKEKDFLEEQVITTRDVFLERLQNKK